MEQSKKTNQNLRTIKTARSVAAINQGVKEGFFPLITEVGDLSLFKSKCLFSQNKITGEVSNVTSDFRTSGHFLLEDDEEEDYKYFNIKKPKYKYVYELPFAAYLLPKDLKKGEKVFLEDLIEDYIDAVWNQGGATRLMYGEAIWTGEKFEIEKHEPRIIFG
jgi:hypothetical protein